MVSVERESRFLQEHSSFGLPLPQNKSEGDRTPLVVMIKRRGKRRAGFSHRVGAPMALSRGSPPRGLYQGAGPSPCHFARRADFDCIGGGSCAQFPSFATCGIVSLHGS
jgi:hypothetical protein